MSQLILKCRTQLIRIAKTLRGKGSMCLHYYRFRKDTINNRRNLIKEN